MVVSLYFGILFGLLLFNLFTHIQIAARSGWTRREISLLSGIAVILVYCVATFVEYRTRDIGLYFTLIRIQVACEPLFFVSLLEFVLAMDDRTAGKSIRALETAFAVIALIRMCLPFAGTYSSVSGMTVKELPLGEAINLIDGRPTILLPITLAFIIAMISLGAASLVKMYRRGGGRIAASLLAALGILLLGIIIDVAIASGIIRWLYMTEGSYVAFITIASLEVTDEVVLFSELKKELERSIDEKDILIMEIHHRVKNNLQVIASLLSLQAEASGSSEAKSSLLESMDRVRSISLVHEQLYASDNLSDIDFAEYSSMLVQGIRSSLAKDDESIVFVPDIGELKIHIGLAVPLGLMLNELATNSIKYAKRDGKALRIALAASRTGDRIAFDYSDDGPGFPPGLDPQREGNLGLTLIRTLAAQVGATGGFRLDRKGISYRIEFAVG